MSRDFRLLWLAGLISIAGDWAMRVALPVYVLALTGDPSDLAATVTAALAASLLVGPLAGAWVDRWDRRRVLVAGNLALAATMVPLLSVDSADEVWTVVAVAFAESAVAQFLGPAENALLPRLVKPEHLARANSLNTLNNFIARLTGPAAGGLLGSTVGLAGAAALNGATFLAAAGLCAAVRGRHRAEYTRKRLVFEIADGLRTATGHRVTRAALVFLAIVSVGEGIMGSLLAVFVTATLDGTGRDLGWMLSAQAVGGILGALVGPRLRGRPVPLCAAGYVLFGLGDILIFTYAWWGGPLWPVVVFFFLIGIPGAVAYPRYLTLVQRATPDTFRGRVFAALGVCGAAAGTGGALLAGALAPTVGVVGLLIAQGAGYIVAGLLFLVLAGRTTDAAPREREGVV